MRWWAVFAGITTSEIFLLIKLLTSEATIHDIVSFTPTFFKEIERLDAIGFVSPIKKDGIVAIRNEHGNWGDMLNLRKYVELTEKGRNYLNVIVGFGEEANANHYK
jgi:hypothetical protein